MLVVMEHGATPDDVKAVVNVIEEMGLRAHPMPGATRTARPRSRRDGPQRPGASL